MHSWRSVFASQVVPLQEVSSSASSSCFNKSGLSLLSFVEHFVNMHEDLADVPVVRRNVIMNGGYVAQSQLK
jgi:hypothetical protein